jgi:hypothetical protein
MSQDAIQAQAAIDIAAAPERVAAVYRDVERWDVTFPATIQQARVVSTGDNWQEVEVAHRMEGRVPNTLIFLSATEIGLEESKRRFDARFLNRFEPGRRRRHTLCHMRPHPPQGHFPRPETVPDGLCAPASAQADEELPARTA